MNALWHRARNGLSARLARNWVPDAELNKANAPLVSFSFDDFPHSAAIEGTQILEQFNVKGTYFVSGARCGKRVEDIDHFTKEDLTEIARFGHEIGCHTFSHMRLPGAPHSEIDNDLRLNQDFVNDILGYCPLSSFAYPFGDVSIEAKALVRRRFRVCRGIDWGINRGIIDLGQLKAVLVNETLDRRKIAKLLDAAQASNGWVIFFTHDIAKDANEFGCRPGAFVRLVNDVVDRCIAILPINIAAEQIRGARSASRKSSTGSARLDPAAQI